MKVIFGSFLLFLLLSPFSNGQVPNQSAWESAIVADSLYSKGYRWHEVKAFNQELHVLFMHTEPEGYENVWLTYGYSPDEGKTWTFEKIDGRKKKVNYTGVNPSIAPFNASLELDHCGKPHIAWVMNYFYDNLLKPSAIIHAEKVDGVWRHDTVLKHRPREEMIKFDQDLKIGQNNEPCIMFLFGTTAHYAQRGQGTWTIETVGQEGKSLNSCRFDIAPNGTVHAMLGLANRSIVHYIRNGPGRWHRGQEFYTRSWVVDIAVDGKNTPHMLYAEATSRPFYHRSFTGKEWSKPVRIDLEETSGHGNTLQARLEIDVNNHLHAAYFMHSPSKEPAVLKYAWSTNGGENWKNETITAITHGFVETTRPGLSFSSSYFYTLYRDQDEILTIGRKPVSRPDLEKTKRSDCLQH